MVSWKHIESPGDLWLSAPAPRLVGVPSPDLLEPILGDDKADLVGEETDLGEDASLAGEEAGLDDKGDLGDLGEEENLGDEDADLGEEAALAG